jgi:hypothetical protein
MKVSKIINYFNESPEDFPLGYSFLELIEVKYKHKYSSRSDIHNSDRYISGLFYKEISNTHKYNNE